MKIEILDKFDEVLFSRTKLEFRAEHEGKSTPSREQIKQELSAKQGTDKELMVTIDKRLTDLENKFTPIGDGVYSVDPNTTWPPSRGEYTMKQNMNANKITVLEETIDRLEKTLEKLEGKLDNKADK